MISYRASLSVQQGKIVDLCDTPAENGNDAGN